MSRRVSLIAAVAVLLAGCGESGSKPAAKKPPAADGTPAPYSVPVSSPKEWVKRADAICRKYADRGIDGETRLPEGFPDRYREMDALLIDFEAEVASLEARGDQTSARSHSLRMLINAYRQNLKVAHDMFEDQGLDAAAEVFPNTDWLEREIEVDSKDLLKAGLPACHRLLAA